MEGGASRPWRRRRERQQEQFHFLALVGCQLQKRLRGAQPFTAMKCYGVDNGIGATVVQVRSGIAQAPERGRPPFAFAGRPGTFRRGCRLILGGSIRPVSDYFAGVILRLRK